MSPRSRTLILVSAIAAATLTGCGSQSEPENNALVVATTVSPLTSIVANIAGDRAKITGIVPEGTNSHTFEPQPKVAELLSTADVIFVNGLKLEDPTLDLAEKNKKSDATIVSLGDRAISPDDYIFDFSFPKEEGKPNPHLWTDPTLATKYAAVIRDELTAKDPDGAATYQANFKAFEQKTEALAKALRADQATVPGGIKLVTYHDAYAYVAKNFGWQVVGAIQPKNFADPTPAEVAALIRQITSARVKAIFGSEVFPSPILAEIAKESGATYVDTLRDDDLPGEPGQRGHSWLELMRSNYVTMITGLGGKATALAALDTADVTTDNAAYPQ